MMVRFLGAMKSGAFRAGFFVVVENQDLIRCMVCGQSFKVGEHIAKSCLEGLPWIDHHMRCAAEGRKKLDGRHRSGAGGRSPLAG